MTTIGFATIGESPRSDVVPAILDQLGRGVHATERGCLDGLSRQEIDALVPSSNEVGIVTLLKNGDSVLLSHNQVVPRMQPCVNELVHDEIAGIVVILCGADWSTAKSERLIVNPGRLFPATISALSYGRKVGIIKPSAGQVDQERTRYASIGIDATVTSASPYAGEARLGQAIEAMSGITSSAPA